MSANVFVYVSHMRPMCLTPSVPFRVSRCKQVAGDKTIMMTVQRPAALTAFGGEWVKLYPKDSWANVTNEYAGLQSRDADPRFESRVLPSELPTQRQRRSANVSKFLFGLSLHTHARLGACSASWFAAERLAISQFNQSSR